MSDVWFITGTSSGLGRAFAIEALKAGKRVVATLRKPEAIKDLTESYSPDKLLICKLDVTVLSDINAAFSAAQKQFGVIDVVVNNAGYGLFSELEGTPDEEARKLLEVNFWGAVNVTREAVRFFREENPAGKGGIIFHITSVGGFIGNCGLSFYSASKFALEGFAESMAKEIPPTWNIHNVIVQPGGFRTEWAKGSMVALPQHPAYAFPDAPTSLFRKVALGTEFPGDPVKAARVLLEVATMKDLPLRLQLGKDSVFLIRRKVQQMLDETDKWEALASSTNADDAQSNVEHLRANLK